MQCTTPATHSPMSVPHFAPPPGSPSSVSPLQSLSLLSHSSGIGFLLHVNAPLTHCLIAPEHSPVWFVQGSPPSATVPSSIEPLQSLSLPSQISAPVGTHVPLSLASSLPLPSLPLPS